MKTEHLTASRRPATGLQAESRHAASGHDISPPRRRSSWLAIRALDLLGAMLLLCLLAVPMLLIGLLVKLTSFGPAMYRQERTGLHGRSFVMFKFRTMRIDAEERTGPVWARRGDPRRTTIGILLRRLSLDELPQLFNVLRGDMSLVGPRPERPFFVNAFTHKIPRYDERHQVPPGITGWAQINGWRGDSSIEKRLECDLYYIRHRSFWFNLRILLETPLKVLVEQNAC